MARNLSTPFKLILALAAVAIGAPRLCPFAVAAAADSLWSGHEIPVTGEILSGSEEIAGLDAAMKKILTRHDVPAAGVAITHGGKLIAARGYGWADVQARTPAQPDTLFALASVSKPITAVTVLRLVEQGKLKLDDHVFELLGDLKAPPGHKFDERLRQITVRMLLDHSGGWNRAISGDPTGFGAKAAKELNVKEPVTTDQLIFYNNGLPLDFDPGTQQHYSNYGFMLLGRLIEHVTGEGYAAYVQKETLGPIGIHTVRMDPLRVPGKELAYLPGQAKRYVHGKTEPVPTGRNAECGAAGGWCGSAVAMARFLTAVDGSRTGKTFLDAGTMKQMLARPEPPLQIRKNGSWFGLGWDGVRDLPKWPHGAGLAYAKDGGLPGTSTWIEHLPGDINWVVLLNVSGKEAAEEDQSPGTRQTTPLQDARKDIVDLLKPVKQWPEGDLFEKYR